MEVLLTVEEIAQALFQGIGGDREGDEYEVVARMQLRKVAELHRAIIETDDTEVTKLLKIQDFWNSLKKQVDN